MVSKNLWEVTTLFLKLGLTAFGGPAAHSGLFRREVVERRKWLTDEQFLDLMAAANLIPGPNSTELAIHLGYQRAGWPGLIAAGLGFILPGMLIVLGLSWLYINYGSTPQATGLLYGIKPVIIAIILNALWEWGKKVFKTPLSIAVGLFVVVLSFLGVNEILLLFGSGFFVMVWKNRQRLSTIHWKRTPVLLPWILPVLTITPVPFSLPTLFWVFFKVGALLYGSGYVLAAFLRADLVERLGWLTEQQLIDAIAIGQVTPGPLFTTATFIGYTLGGMSGALLATLGIFLPAFLFVALSSPFISRINSSPWSRALLDGVITASLGLMLVVTIQLGHAALIDQLTWILFAASFIVLLRFRIDATWLIIAGGLVGLTKSS
jgi:chromate transporter